ERWSWRERSHQVEAVASIGEPGNRHQSPAPLLQLAPQIEIITSSKRCILGTPLVVFCFCFGATHMAETVELKTQDRAEHGTRHARRLRKSGQVPAVLYGHGEKTLALALSADDLSKAIRHGARVVDISHNGNT